MKTAQATAEFAMAFSMILLLFLLALSALNIYFNENLSKGASEVGLFLSEFDSKIEMVTLSKHSVRVPIVFPREMDGINYSIQFMPDPLLGKTVMSLRLSDDPTDHVRYLQYIQNETPLIAGDIYRLTKNASGVYIGP